MYVALFIVTIVGAILLHEFGHFATAKAFGMRVTQFFVGFGPTIWSTRRGETEYGLKGIPAGGFVKISGMTPWEDADPADDGRLFYQQAPWKRLIVLSAGSFTHLLLAIALLFGALAFVGLPTGEATNGIGGVAEDSPAMAAGLQPGEVIVGIDGRAIGGFEEIREALEGRAGDTVALELASAEGQQRSVELTLDTPHPDPERAGDGYLGVSPVVEEEPLGLVGGARATFSGDFSIWSVMGVTLDGLGQVFGIDQLAEFFASVDDEGPRSPNSVVSLVGAGQIVNEFGNRGDVFMVLLMLAQLNLVLGLLNMLPLPPLDGGHVAVMAVEEAVNGTRRLRARGDQRPRPFHLNPSVVTPIALAVLAFFIVLSGTALYLDITNPASSVIQ